MKFNFLKKKNRRGCNLKFLGYVWYMCLKIENYCLKTFVEICVDKKVRENI